MSAIQVPSIARIKSIIDMLDDLGIDPLHFHADGSKVTDARPNMRLWLRTRTDFFAFCEHIEVKAKEARWDHEGQRTWHAEADNDGQRMLIACVSFAHHDDWEPRRKPEPQPAESDLFGDAA